MRIVNPVNPTDVSIPLTPNVRSSFKNGFEMSDEPLRYLIEGFMLEECGTFFAGLSGHMKTLYCVIYCKAFITRRHVRQSCVQG